MSLITHLRPRHLILLFALTAPCLQCMASTPIYYIGFEKNGVPRQCNCAERHLYPKEDPCYINPGVAYSDLSSCEEAKPTQAVRPASQPDHATHDWGPDPFINNDKKGDGPEQGRSGGVMHDR